jgi:thymidylate kinase
MLILEGSDCLGKSTFAEKLLAEADSRVIHPTFYSHMSRPNNAFDFFTHYQDMITKYAIQDRFHIGGIVWHDRIPQDKLDIIEAWLALAGSLTIVLYASDDVAYRELLKKDQRGNLLSLDTMCDANKEYRAMAKDNHELSVNINYSYDITPTCVPIYPDQQDVELIIDEWFDKLRLLETL